MVHRVVPGLPAGKSQGLILYSPSPFEANNKMVVLAAVERSVSIFFLLALLLFSEKMPAQARSCQSYEAAYNLEARMREGMSLKQARESVVEDEYSDGTTACFSAIKHEINQMPYAFPLVNRALYKRMRR